MTTRISRCRVGHLPNLGHLMRFFGLKTCDTSRAALAAIRAKGLDPQVIDVRSDGVSPADLDAMLAAFGDRAINRSSTTWRALMDAEKAVDPAVLLTTHPTVMKRPVIEVDGIWYLGWDKTVQKAVLG